MKSIIAVLIVFFSFYNENVVANNESDSKITAGWLESIVFTPWNVGMRAKLDTGAKTSSLHAMDIERFEKNGEQWVRFKTHAYDEKREILTIELPLVREVKIKRHTKKAAIRPVVEINLCLHNKLFKGEFSLTNRKHFNYPVLLGRSMLQQGIIVDPAMTFTGRTDKKKCSKLMEIDEKNQSTK